jgi:hypothetical protein
VRSFGIVGDRPPRSLFVTQQGRVAPSGSRW